MKRLLITIHRSYCTSPTRKALVGDTAQHSMNNRMQRLLWTEDRRSRASIVSDSNVIPKALETN